MEGKAWHDGKARQNGKMLFMCSETIKFCFCLICIHHLSFLFIFLYVHTCVWQKHGVPYWKINAKVLIILDSSCIIIMDLYKESFTIWFEYCNNLSQNSPDSGLFSRNSLEYISCQTYIFWQRSTEHFLSVSFSASVTQFTANVIYELINFCNYFLLHTSLRPFLWESFLMYCHNSPQLCRFTYKFHQF